MDRAIERLLRFFVTPLGRRFLGLLLLLALLDDLHYRFVPTKEYKPVCYLEELQPVGVADHLDIEGPYFEPFLNAFSGELDKDGVPHLRHEGRIYTTREVYRGNPRRDHYEGPRDDSPKWKRHYTSEAVMEVVEPILPSLYEIDDPIEEVWDLTYCYDVRRVVRADGDIAALVAEEQRRHAFWRKRKSSEEFDERMLKSDPTWCDRWDCDLPPGGT